MIKTLLAAAWLFLYLFSLTPQYLRAKSLKKRGRADEAAAIVDKQAQRWGKHLFHIIHMDITTAGRENLPGPGETVVFAANHQSYIDVPLVMTHLDGPHPIMAKAELGKIPFIGGWMRILDCVLVERDDMRAAATALQKTTELVKEGRSIIVFPEGTRTKKGEVNEFKGGAFRAAVKNGAPIIPLVIDGTFRALEGNRYRVQPTKVKFTILPRVETAGLTKEEQKALPAKIEAIIRTAKDGGHAAR